MVKRSLVVVACLLVGTLVAASLFVITLRSYRSWAWDGYQVAVSVDVRLAESDTFDATVTALGGPRDRRTGVPAGWQAVVASVVWDHGTADPGKTFLFVALDKRVTPPRPLSANGAMGADGETGSMWSSSLDELAERYDWLAGAGPVSRAGTTSPHPSAVSVLTAERSSLVATWFVAQDGLPLTDPTTELIVGLIYFDNEHNEARWAKRIYG